MFRIISSRQEIHTISTTWLDSLQANVDEIKADIANIKATQSDHGEILKNVATKEDLTVMATKDDIAGIKATQDLILQLLQAKQ